MLKLFKYTIGGSLGLLGSYAAYNKGDLNSLGIVRFGRAANAVKCLFFYIMS